MNATPAIARIAAVFAAAVVTTVLVGSQFGLAQRYDAQAQAVMAGQAATGQLAKAAQANQAG